MIAIFIITSNNKTPQSLNLRHLVFPAPESTLWHADCSQLTQFTQGGSKVRRSCQSTIVGGACADLHHSDKTLGTAWFEKGDLKKKNTGWIFIIIGWMCTYTSNTNSCSNNLKIEFCIRWPLLIIIICIMLLFAVLFCFKWLLSNKTLLLLLLYTN